MTSVRQQPGTDSSYSQRIRSTLSASSSHGMTTTGSTAAYHASCPLEGQRLIGQTSDESPTRNEF